MTEAPDKLKLSLLEATHALRSGSVVGLPTETVYGLAADIAQPEAVAKIFALKERPENHPLIVHIAKFSQLNRYAKDIPPYAIQLAAACWPGPLTLILSKTEAVGDIVTGGQQTVGIRMPKHPMALAIIQSLDSALAAPSANRFGKISPTTPEHVFSEFDGKVSVIDGGPCEVGIESTIVLATEPDRLTILRPGQIGVDKIQSIVGEGVMVSVGGSSTSPKVSGNLDSHYAPTKPAVLVASLPQWQALKERFSDSIATLAYSDNFRNNLATEPFTQFLSAEPQAYAQQLYQALRQADNLNVKVIAIEAPPADSAWLAVSDRLQKATAKGLRLDIGETTR